MMETTNQAGEQAERREPLPVDALGAAHLGTWEWDVGENTFTWSPELFKIYGLTRKEFTPSFEGYLQRLHPDDRVRVHDAMMNARADHNSFSHDERIVKPGGQIAYLHTWGQPILDEHGKTTRIIGVSLDNSERKNTEEKMQEAERFRSIIFDTVGDILFYLGVEPEEKFRFLAVNDAFSQTTGLSRDRVLGHWVDEVLAEPALGAALERYRKAIAERRSIRWEEVSIYPAGTKYGEVTVTPLFGEDGHCVGLVGTIHDVTERVEAEAETHKTLTILNAVIEGTTDAIYVKDAQGRYLMINSAGARFYGRPVNEIIGATDTEILPAETAAAFLDVDRLAKNSGVTQVYEETGHLAGSLRTLLTAKGPYLDAEGRVIGVIGISRDITERREAEEQRNRSATRMKFLADTSRTFVEARFDLAAILTATAARAADFFQDGCIVRLFSETKTQLRAAAFHHVDPDALAAMHQIIPASQAFLDPAAFDELMRSRKPVRVAVEPGQAHTRIHPDYGPVLDRFPVHAWLVVPLLVGGEITGTVTVFRSRPGPGYSTEDEALLRELAERATLSIDNARLYEKAKKAIQLREDFMAMASHELNTPLTPLKMQMQLLSRFIQSGDIPRDSNTSKLAALIADSEQQINRLTRLVEDMLDVVQIQTGSLAFRREDVDFNALVSAAVERVRPNAEAVKSALQLTAVPLPPGNWDALRIERAVTCLLSNAIKYGAGKPIDVTLSQTGHLAVLTVRDQGNGVRTEDSARIFERFERDASIQHFGGLGLGLYISRQVVEAHGGRLWLASEPGKGSLFTLELPLSPADAPI